MPKKVVAKFLTVPQFANGALQTLRSIGDLSAPPRIEPQNVGCHLVYTRPEQLRALRKETREAVTAVLKATMIAAHTKGHVTWL